jgi:hypothetical protein
MHRQINRAASTLALVLFAGAAAAQPAPDKPAFETSEDGHIRVPVRASHTGGAGWSRADEVPFGTTAGWELALRRQVGGMQIADMNGDGRNDLIVGVFHSDSFPPYEDWHDMIFYNTGSELESSPSWISSDQTHTGDVQIGDVNLDGHLDYFAVSGGGSYSQPRIYLGSASGPAETAGWFGVPPESGWATSGLLVDIDKDGDLDVFTTNQGVSPNPYRAMYMWRNQAGVLDTTTSWQSAEESIQNGLASADYDGDGWPDVAVAKWVNFMTAIYRNDGSGTLQTFPAWTTGDDGTDKGVAFADVDGNGWPDLAVGHDEPSRLYGNHDGVLSLAWESDAPFYGQQEVRFFDVDSDGDPDYCETNFSDGRTHIYLNRDGMLDVQPSWTYDASTVANTHAFGDINGDGLPDLAIGFSGDISIRVFYAEPPDCVADFNGDGTVNTQDVLAFLNAWNADDSRADINGDGSINTQDVLAFLNLWNAGC